MINKDRKKYFDTNQQLWNSKTPWHIQSDFYDVPGFLAGKTSLMPTELQEVGAVQGKRLLHLQCHFGQDTLSWARLGAEVVGVDFSPVALAAARDLQAKLGLPAQFIECNIFDLPQQLAATPAFDIVFTSYGTITWLDDLEAWAAIVARYLKPGGFFYIIDFHPAYLMFNFETMQVEYDYFKSETPFTETVSGTYADPQAPIQQQEYFWNHSISETMSALIGAGLQLEFFHEFPFSHYDCFSNLIPKGERRYVVRDYEGMLPLMFSMKWRKG